VADLSDPKLADALVAGVAEGFWSEQAAVGLLVTQRRWLGSWDLRRAVQAQVEADGLLRAWVDWPQVEAGPASSGELQILELVLSLAGVTPGRGLDDLLSGLDDTNTDRVLHAFEVACRGPNPPRWRRADPLAEEE
jgi:hypothetical protein